MTESPASSSAFGESSRQQCGVVGAALGIVRQRAAGAGICGRRVAVRRVQRGGDIRAGAEAGVNQAARAQLFERRFVVGAALRLDQHRLVPVEPEPAQVLVDAVDELGPAARLVEVLDPEQELAAAGARARVTERPRCRRGRGAAVRSATARSG